MKKTKITLMIASLSVLTALTTMDFFVRFDRVSSKKRVNAQVHSDSCVFNHYEAVSSTEDSHGSVEFWACCTHHSFLLENPDFGTINDVGAFSGYYFEQLTPDDPRYLAPLPKTRTISFYCDDLLISTKQVLDKEKTTPATSSDFIIGGWYRDRDLTESWDFENDLVGEDLSLYANYIAKEKVFAVDEGDAPSIDSFGFGETNALEKEICISKGASQVNSFAALENRGILFNKNVLGLINRLSVNIANNGFSSAKLYYGDCPLSFEHSVDLTAGDNLIDLSNAEYFTIQNIGPNNISINSLEINYVTKTIFEKSNIPSIYIDTKNSQTIASRVNYVECNISTIGADKDVTDLKASIKIRGNSTAGCPKKPYRIKLDKKNSLFGYTKAKNWVLLADYMDGSNMHNYAALKFAKMVRGENSFGVSPLHVNVFINGAFNGLYEFGEHIDAKEGRLDMEQEEIWKKNFDDINFYVERDLSTTTDPEEIEGETYFRVDLEGYTPNQYVFALKYPEKEDFEEELENGETIIHEEEFYSFFDSLKTYITDVCQRFVEYSSDTTRFSDVSSVVDVSSLATYSVVDQMFRESDHNQKSFKMYRKDGGLLKFGPNWDYDSCAYGLPYQGTYVLNPFEVGSSSFNSTYFSEKWGYMLFNDIQNGRPLFKTIWDSISSTQLDKYLNDQFEEIQRASFSSMLDCELWMNNQFYSLFDNLQYFWKYISIQLPFLKQQYL